MSADVGEGSPVGRGPLRRVGYVYLLSIKTRQGDCLGFNMATHSRQSPYYLICFALEVFCSESLNTDTDSRIIMYFDHLKGIIIVFYCCLFWIYESISMALGLFQLTSVRLQDMGTFLFLRG